MAHIIRTPAYDKEGKLTGYYYHEGDGKTFIPLSGVEVFERDKKIRTANADLDGVVKEIMSEPLERKDLQIQLSVLMRELRDLSKFETMNSKSKSDLLAKARKAVNLFVDNYSRIAVDVSLKRFEDDFLALGKALNQYTHIQKEIKLPDLKAYRASLLDPEIQKMEHYVNKVLFTYSARLTLFDLNKKGHLEDELKSYLLRQDNQNKKGVGLNFYDQVDELMAMLDRDYPTGYIKLPVVRVSTRGSTVNGIRKKEYRKMALDYYLSVWLSDLEATVHNAATHAAYMKAGIDLVIIKNASANPCDICAPDIDKIFSLSGNDPDFRVCPYLPRHPHCTCFTTPVLDNEFWKTAEDVKWEYNDENEVRKNIKNGVFNMDIVSAKQNHHIVGSPEYVEGKSILSANPRELLDKYAGSGKIMMIKKKWVHKERIYCDEVIGIHKNQNGLASETKVGMIHYSKKGVHVVPAKEPEKGGKL
jgi:hypothetical protein